jgi:hypothetical protein
MVSGSREGPMVSGPQEGSTGGRRGGGYAEGAAGAAGGGKEQCRIGVIMDKGRVKRVTDGPTLGSKHMLTGLVNGERTGISTGDVTGVRDTIGSNSGSKRTIDDIYFDDNFGK